jgi:hypothetical protein
MSSTPTPKRRRLNSMIPTTEYCESSWHTFTWLNPLTTDGLHSRSIDSETLVALRYHDRSPPTTFHLDDSLNTLSFNDNLDDITTKAETRRKGIVTEAIINAETDVDVLALSREQYILISILNFLLIRIQNLRSQFDELEVAK